MPVASEKNNTAGVDAFIKALDPELSKIAEAVRQIILDCSSQVDEHIKWNAPAFFYTGEMEIFNPKEYKRDIVVFNVRKGCVMLVFPTGATIDDHSGLLEGNYKDGRRLAIFNSMAEVKKKRLHLQTAIKNWLMHVQ